VTVDNGVLDDRSARAWLAVSVEPGMPALEQARLRELAAELGGVSRVVGVDVVCSAVAYPREGSNAATRTAWRHCRGWAWTQRATRSRWLGRLGHRDSPVLYSTEAREHRVHTVPTLRRLRRTRSARSKHSSPRST